MINFFKKNWKLLSIFIITFIIYFPSLFVFYTNDDFFFLKISKINSFLGFINFFNLVKGPEGFGVYRPLTTQVYYFLATNIFRYNPVFLHLISFIFFFGIIYLIYKLVIDLTGNKNIALISAYLYGVSATHFGHLYYLATFQELGMVFFVLLGLLSFLRSKTYTTIFYFILALLSKETALVFPGLLVIIYLYQKYRGFGFLKPKKFIKLLVTISVLVIFYLCMRIFFYGFASGDSYVWNFSPVKLINTVSWYVVWSLNLPESVIDFIGPGLNVNPNLLLYWSRDIIPILILFALELLGIAAILIKSILWKNQKQYGESSVVSTFSIFWFLITLLPVVFLPIHKFVFYLTLPLIGVVFRISYLLIKTKPGKLFTFLLLAIWTALSVLTLHFTIKTNWITQGEKISRRVYEYFRSEDSVSKYQRINFSDTINDKLLPWSPTGVLKTTLSDKNFFYVFYPNLVDKVSYGLFGNENINSRQFLGY